VRFGGDQHALDDLHKGDGTGDEAADRDAFGVPISQVELAHRA
jgi:hypothetical protein